MKLRKLHIIIILLFVSSCVEENDWRFTLDKNSTEPFGLYLAYDRLDDVFPTAKKKTIYDLSKEISEQVEKYYFSDRNRVIVSITSGMYLNNDEIDNLRTYVSKGGNVLMLSQGFSDYFDTVFNFKLKSGDMRYPPSRKDSFTTVRNLWDGVWYDYEIDVPFQKSYLTTDSGLAITQKKMNDGELQTTIVKRYIGEGQIVIGTCPELLTNYALLKNENIHFYEQLFGHFKGTAYQVNWFSKLTVSPDRSSRTSSLSKLLKEKSYLYAFLVMLLMAALFFLFETRRRQRIVEVVPPVSNDSLAFTETIGQLYYGEKDNANLARKMIRYYLEHIRTTYNIPTAQLDKELIDKLARKLNKPKDEAGQFVNYLNQQLTAYSISEQEIKILYKTLKKYS